MNEEDILKGVIVDYSDYGPIIEKYELLRYVAERIKSGCIGIKVLRIEAD